MGALEKNLEAARLIGRCRELCERLLRAQGDRAEMELVQLQHDCAEWAKAREGAQR